MDFMAQRKQIWTLLTGWNLLWAAYSSSVKIITTEIETNWTPGRRDLNKLHAIPNLIIHDFCFFFLFLEEVFREGINFEALLKDCQRLILPL
jgi:hypothetical protein